jgi:hypothetical protein
MKKILIYILGGLLGLQSSALMGQCDPRFGGATFTGTSREKNVARIKKNELGTLEWTFGVGPQPKCNGKSKATGAAGSMTMVITFPKHFDPDKTPTGVDAGKWDWKQKTEKGIKKLVGINNAPLGKISQRYELKVRGKIKSATGEVPRVILEFKQEEGNGITNASPLNDSLTAGMLVDEGPSNLELPVIGAQVQRQKQELNLQVYPNPTSHYVMIEGLPTESTNRLVIYTIQGIKVAEYKTSQSTARIDLQALPAGVYQILIKDDKGNYFARKLLIS